MFKSLFGELGPSEGGAPGPAPARDFPSTAVLESGAFNVHHQLKDGDAQSLFVTGSAAQAIRDHFRRQTHEGGSTAAMVTLVDLSRARAPALLRALSHASGSPLERMDLREQATLRTLSTVERVSVSRRERPPLKIYHADSLTGTMDEAEIATALAERSRLTAVLISGASVDVAMGLVRALHDAVQQSTWRCPSLAFFVPADAAWLASRIRGMGWPASVSVDVLADPGGGNNALWQALLQLWERRDVPTLWNDAAEGVDLALVGRLLTQLAQTEGLLACALVDAAAGTVLAGELPRGGGDSEPNLQRAAMACSLALRSHQHAARSMGLPPIEEIALTAGDHQQLLRVVGSHPGWFLLAMLDRRRTNATLARFKLLEAEKSLG